MVNMTEVNLESSKQQVTSVNQMLRNAVWVIPAK